MIKVKTTDRQTKVLCLETRQQVCLIFFFRGSNFVRLFSKKPNKIATSKEKYQTYLLSDIKK